jgi:hypothetical protein
MSAAEPNRAPLHPRLAEVTARIRARSAETRRAYLARMAEARGAGTARTRLACTNLAHAIAASVPEHKRALRLMQWPNVGIVSAYNDMLSAHQPFERFPSLIKTAAREAGAVAQFAGGVPAMCDGVVPEKIGLDKRAAFYESTGAYRDMVVTHLFQILAFMAMEPPTSLEPKSIGEEKHKVFRSMRSIESADVVRGQYLGYRAEEGVDPESDTETFIALKCAIDNWRWAGVPFYLRTGKCMAEGQRIISIAFREPPKSMFPPGSGVGSQGPDHLTFDLADLSKVSLSFYGKRPGPGMRLDKLSLQFAMHDTGLSGDALEAYERLILDAMRGDHMLFTTAEGIERLWEVSTPLLESPPPVRVYAAGSWGPNAIHQLVAPHAWRLPFERVWRDPNPAGA